MVSAARVAIKPLMAMRIIVASKADVYPFQLKFCSRLEEVVGRGFLPIGFQRLHAIEGRVLRASNDATGLEKQLCRVAIARVVSHRID